MNKGVFLFMETYYTKNCKYCKYCTHDFCIIHKCLVNVMGYCSDWGLDKDYLNRENDFWHIDVKVVRELPEDCFEKDKLYLVLNDEEFESIGVKEHIFVDGEWVLFW